MTSENGELSGVSHDDLMTSAAAGTGAPAPGNQAAFLVDRALGDDKPLRRTEMD